mgnify:CR=1 FL=1
MSPPCDVAVYEQGVWFLRLSAVLLLASFTNYASLPSKRKSAPAVAQVEEIQEAVAVPAAPAVPETQQGVRQGVQGVRQGVRQGVQGMQGGADISVPPLPNSSAKKKTKRRGVKGSRIEERQKPQASVARNQIRSGSVRKRRRAASQPAQRSDLNQFSSTPPMITHARATSSDRAPASPLRIRFSAL